MDDQELYYCDSCPDMCEYADETGCDLTEAGFYDDPDDDATCPCCGELATSESSIHESSLV